MSQVFEGYERQYCEISSNLTRKCASAAILNGEQKKQKVSEIKGGLDEAESLIRKMDLEARTLQPNVKAMVLSKLREYKNDLNNLKTEMKKLSSTDSQAARDALLESGMADALMASSDQRGRLLTSTERLNQSSDRVRQSRMTMQETESIGVSILEDLHQQRQSLLHAHNTTTSRPSGGMGPFSQGQPPFPHQQHHQSQYQEAHIMSGDFNSQNARNMQMERPPWPPISRENTAGAQLPAPPSLGPGQLPVGNQQPRPAPLTPEVEHQLLQQVMSLTPEQINLLPPEQRHQVLQLQQMLRQ